MRQGALKMLQLDCTVLASVLIAQGRLDEATDLLHHLFEAAEAGERTSRAIEIMLLQALAFQAGDNLDRAFDKLASAFILAEPAGFVRIFVDEGTPMARLLYKALAHGIASDYVRRLLSAFPVETVFRGANDDWIAVHAEASRIPFDFSARPAIRLILVHSPDENEVIIQCHHTICDGLSLAYLARDLMICLGDLAHKVDVLPAPEPITLDNLPADVSQSGLRKMLIRRMNRTFGFPDAVW